MRKLAARYNRSESTIRYTINTYASRPTTEDRPRSGRPPILSRHQQKLVYRAARKTPKIGYHELQKVAPVVTLDTPPQKPPSRSTLYRYLKRQGLTCNAGESRSAELLRRPSNAQGVPMNSDNAKEKTASRIWMSRARRVALRKQHTEPHARTQHCDLPPDTALR